MNCVSGFLNALLIGFLVGFGVYCLTDDIIGSIAFGGATFALSACILTGLVFIRNAIKGE